MVSCFRFCMVLIPMVFSIATLIIACIACAGSAKDMNPINQIYELELDFSDMDISTVLANTEYSSLTLSSLGLSEIYSVGMWGYCKGDKSTDTDGYTVTWCSKAKAMYVFDPVEIITSELNATTTTTSDLENDIELPDKVQNYISTVKNISKLIFICTIIGICSTFLVGFFSLFSFCSHCISFIASVFGVVAFLSFLLVACTSTGAMMLIKKYFNDATSSYGITATLGNRRFFALIWASVGGALLNGCSSILCICCGSTGKKKVIIEEKQPFMGYQ